MGIFIQTGWIPNSYDSFIKDENLIERTNNK